MPKEQQLGTESDGIALLKSRLGRFETEEGRLSGLNYQPRPNDVVITTTPKAGTTWLQQVGFFFSVIQPFGIAATIKQMSYQYYLSKFCKDLPSTKIRFRWWRHVLFGNQ